MQDKVRHCRVKQAYPTDTAIKVQQYHHRFTQDTNTGVFPRFIIFITVTIIVHYQQRIYRTSCYDGGPYSIPCNGIGQYLESATYRNQTEAEQNSKIAQSVIRKGGAVEECASYHDCTHKHYFPSTPQKVIPY